MEGGGGSAEFECMHTGRAEARTSLASMGTRSDFQQAVGLINGESGLIPAAPRRAPAAAADPEASGTRF